MNRKRWLAILAAVILFVISLGFMFVTNLVTSNFAELFKVEDKQFTEKVIEDGGSDKIAVLHLEGVIQGTAGNSIINSNTYNHKRFLEMLEEAGEDKTVDGIILRVNSPGGGVVESAEIHDKIVDIQEKHEKPVYVSMGNTAASGGYYIAAPADKIVAHAATLTGSIGVIMESINFSEFADEHGIDFNTIKSGEFKDIMSPSRKMTEEEHDILQTMIDELYGEFVQVIVDGRGLSEEKVRQIGDGRVYTGTQAKELALVDEIGSMDDTITMMKEDHKLKNATVVEYQNGFSFGGFLNSKVQSILGAKSDLIGIKELLRESNAPRAMYLYSN